MFFIPGTMFFIPGAIISIFTFPGVIVHELAHQLFCYWRRVPVYEVKYFQVKMSGPCGYVVYERSENPTTIFIISVGPFIVNTLLGACILIPASIMDMFGQNPQFTPLIIWLGISVLMHAFPSIGDAQVIISTILKNKEINIVIRILAAPIVGLIYLGSIGSVIWLDLGYALLIWYYLLPKLIPLIL